MTKRLSDRLRAEAVIWGAATHTVAGPTTAALLIEAADELDRKAHRAGRETIAAIISNNLGAREGAALAIADEILGRLP